MTDPIEYCAAKIAKRVVKWSGEENVYEENVVYYLTVQLNQWGIIFFCLSTALIFGHLPNAIIATISFLIIRELTGGLHAPSLSWCFILTSAIILFSSFSVIPIFINNLTIGVSIGLILCYTKGKEKTTIFASIIFSLLGFFSPIVSLAVFFQSLTMIKIGGDSIVKEDL